MSGKITYNPTKLDEIVGLNDVKHFLQQIMKQKDVFSLKSSFLPFSDIWRYKLLHMNPGALGDYGQHKVKTLLYFIIDKKEIKELKVIEYPRN